MAFIDAFQWLDKILPGRQTLIVPSLLSNHRLVIPPLSPPLCFSFPVLAAACIIFPFTKYGAGASAAGQVTA